MWGTGFNRGGVAGATWVWIGSDPCTVVPYYSSDIKLVCYTPPHATPEALTVRVQLVATGFGGTSYATCAPGPCQFTYSQAATPQLVVASLGGAGGATLRFSGGLLQATAQSYMNLYVGSRDSGQRCFPSAAAQNGGLVAAIGSRYSPTEDSLLDVSNAPVVRCEAPPVEAGRYNMSFEVRDPALGAVNFGQAARQRYAKQVRPGAPGGGVFHVTMLPLVSGVSSALYGLAGGGSLTLTGTGFSTAPGGNVVMLLGGDGAGGDAWLPCAVTAASATSLTCTPSGALGSSNTSAAARAFTAGAGVRHSLYSTVGGLFNAGAPWGGGRLPGAPVPLAWALNTDSIQSVARNEATYTYQQLLEGLFTPPVTANYTFFVRGDDAVAIFLSADHTAARLAGPVASANVWSHWVPGWSAAPAPVLLTAGRQYYFSAQHQQAWGPEYIDVAMRIHAEGNPEATAMFSSPAQQALASVPEYQRLQISTATVREVQTLVVAGAAAGGTWIISVGGVVGTAAVALDVGASGSAVKAALEKVGAAVGCSRGQQDFTVVASAWQGPASGGRNVTGTAYAVSINCPAPAAGQTFPVLAPEDVSLRSILEGTGVVLRTSRTVMPSDPLAGSFRLSFAPSLGAAPSLTSFLDFNAPSWAVAQALQVLPGFPADSEVAVISTGSATADGYTYLVVMNGVGVDMPQLVPVTLRDDSSPSLLGANATATVVTLLDGSPDPFFAPMPVADFLEAPAPGPELRLVSNGLLAACAGAGDPAQPSACAFRYDASATPTVSALSPALDAVAGGALTITGTGFFSGVAGESALPIVLLGPAGNATACEVTGATDTSITCTLPNAPAGSQRVTVEVAGRGLAAFSTGAELIFALGVTDVSPTAGSTAGGTLLSISGTGFGLHGINDTAVELRDGLGGAFPCAMVRGDPGFALCTTPSGLAAGTAYTVAVNGVAWGGGAFTPSADYTPALVALSPATLSAAVTGRVNVTVELPSAAPASLPLGASVTLGGRACLITANWSAPTGAGRHWVLSCVLTRGSPLALAAEAAAVAPVVLLPPYGLAAQAGSPLTLDTSFYVTGAELPVFNGSCMGGTLVNISGAGFAASAAATTVFFHPLGDLDLSDHAKALPCTVRDVAADGASITCVTGMPPLDLGVHLGHPLVGSLVVVQNNVLAPSLAGAGTPAFSYDVRSTPFITALVVGGPPDFPFYVNGSHFGEGLQLTFGGANPVAVTVAADGASAWGALPPLAAGAYLLSGSGESGIVMVNATAGVSINSASVAVLPIGDMVYTNPLHVYGLNTTVSGAQGSLAGGHVLTVDGWGFAPFPREEEGMDGAAGGAGPSTAVAVTPNGGVAGSGVLVSATTTQLVFRTPPSAVAAAAVLRFSALDAAGASLPGVPSASLPSAYTYLPTASTPAITSASPSSAAPGATLTLTGTAFGSAQPEGAAVTIGGVPCLITAWAATQISCTLGEVPAGTHRVLLALPQLGLARGAVPFTVAGAAVSGAFTGTSSGFGGGLLLGLSGSGFATAASGGVNTVAVCGVPCAVLSANYSALTCKVAPVATPATVAAFNAVPPSALKGVPFASSTASVSASLLAPALSAAAFDGDASTTFAGLCRVGLDLGVNGAALVSTVRWFSAFKQPAAMLGASWYATASAPAQATSLSAWTLLGTVGASTEGWNDLPVGGGPGSPPWRAVMLLFSSGAATGSACAAGELMVVGVPVLPASFDAASCPINVTVGGPVDPFAGQRSFFSLAPAAPRFSFDLALTPVVTGVTPSNGTALGGTLVTLTGSGFGSDSEGAALLLNGVPCAIASVAAGAITCVTGPRDAIRPLSIALTLPGRGAALYNASRTAFRYLDRWSALTTWAFNEPPLPGDSVVVPEGQAILVDVTPPRLFLVYVAGTLVFDRQDLAFNASYIVVHGGALEVGTEAQPFLNKLTITLHGDRYTDVELPDVGAKVLAVMNRDPPMAMPGGAGGGGGHASHSDSAVGSVNLHMGGDSNMPGMVVGSLDLHGAPRLAVWAKVAATAPAGADTITLAADVDWQPGERVVITSSSSDYTEAEELTMVELVSPRVIRVTPPLRHAHESRIVPAGQWGHSDVDLRCEVGLLSRNVVVQGDDNSPAQQYGCHNVAAHGGFFRYENIEVRRCGQAYNLGRYSTHMHMLGATGATSYVRHNSIHDSFQRMTTVHATHHTTVEGNFGYNIMGHSLFLEDGVERFNVIQNNLIASTVRCYGCLSSDVKPASFWTASPTNFWRNNVAAGSTNDGFWLELPGHPHGPSFTTSYCPVGAPLGEHFGNIAHSNGVHGIRLYPTVTPYNDMCDAASGAAPQYFYNFTSWRNGGHGVFGKRNGALRHVNAKLVENRGDDFNQVKYVGNFAGALGLYSAQDANVANSLLIGTVDPVANPIWGKRAMAIPGFEYFLVAGVTFVNYGATGAVTGCNDCEDQDNYRSGGYTVRFSGLSWVNTTKRVLWQSPHKDIFIDQDGTLTGAGPNTTTLPYYAFNAWPECARDSTGAFDYGHVCSAAVVVRRVQLDSVAPSTLNWLNLNVSSAAGTGAVPFRPKEVYGWAVPLVTNKAGVATGGLSDKAYSLGFMQSPWLDDWETLSLRYSEPDYVTPGEWTRLTFSHIDQRFRNRVRYQLSPLKEVRALPVGALPGPTDMFGTGTTFTGSNDTQRWTVVLSTGNINGTAPLTNYEAYAIAVADIQCPDNGCPVPPRPSLGNMTRWSDPATWPGGVLPKAGDTVVINATQWVQLDVSPPPLARLDVLGKLSFRDGEDRALSVGALVVWGAVEIGTPDAPFMSRAELALTGTRNSPAVVVDNNIFAGNKNIVVLGSFTVCGAPRAATWTRLASTAPAGATTLTLASPVRWYKGEQITLAPTEWDLPMQAETATLAADVSADGLTLTLDAPLAYRHYAGPLATGPTTAAAASARLGAAVGLLTRNVVIRGNVSDAPILIQDANSAAAPYLGPDTYGGHVLVAAVARPGTPRASWRVGALDVRFAELRNMGKQGMQYAAVGVQYGALVLDAADTPQATQALAGLATEPINRLIGNAFSFSFAACFAATAAQNALLDGNVLHQCSAGGVALDAGSTNATITRNLAVDTRLNPAINRPGQTQWVAPMAAFFLDAPTYAAVRGNVAAGSGDAGFALHPEATCGASGAAARAAGYPLAAGAGAAPVVWGNEAYAAVVGVFLLPTPALSRAGAGWCGTATGGWLVAKAAHIGVLAVDGLSDLALLNSTVAECHIGVSLNFVVSSDAQSFSHLQGVTLIGKGPATGAAPAPGACAPSTSCRAATETDVSALAPGGVCGSVMGVEYDRVGLLGPQYMNRGKTCIVDGSLPVCTPPTRPHRLCGMPWETRFGLPSTRSTQLFLDGVTFSGFAGRSAGEGCGGAAAAAASVAYAHNPSQVDMAVPVFARGVAWDGVPRDARFSFRITAATQLTGMGATTTGGGDGLENILLQDDDGSLTGTPRSSVLGPNPAVGEESPDCEWVEAWQGMMCPGLVLRQAVVENMGAWALRARVLAVYWRLHCVPAPSPTHPKPSPTHPPPSLFFLPQTWTAAIATWARPLCRASPTRRRSC